MALLEQLYSAESPRDIHSAEPRNAKVFTITSQSISTFRDATSAPSDVYPGKKRRADTCM